MITFHFCRLERRTYEGEEHYLVGRMCTRARTALSLHCSVHVFTEHMLHVRSARLFLDILAEPLHS